jgi:hypothetical protein
VIREPPILRPIALLAWSMSRSSVRLFRQFSCRDSEPARIGRLTIEWFTTRLPVTTLDAGLVAAAEIEALEAARGAGTCSNEPAESVPRVRHYVLPARA